MSLSAGYSPLGLAPKILINNVAGTLQYTFEAAQVATTPGSPTQDFTLTDGSFHLGVNDDFGYVTLVIDDHDNLFTSGASAATPLIEQQWEVEMYLGKTNATLQRWFFGKVINVTMARPETNMQQMVITCAGWGIKTKYRYTSIKRFQKKESDGISLDATDTSAKVSEYVKDIFQDTDHYITQGLTTESEITVNGVTDMDIKLADFQQTGQTWASAVSTLAAWSDAYWGIDADQDVYFHKVGSVDSGLLFSNDLTGLDVIGWDPDKLGYIKNGNFTWSNSSDQGSFSILHAFGGNAVQIDTNVEPTPNSTFAMDTDWLAWQITPVQNNIEKIALSLNKTGTPASGNAWFFILGDDGAGAPNFNDVRGGGTLGEEQLVALPTSGTNWVEIGFNVRGGIPVNPQDTLYIAVKRYGTASHTFAIENDTTTDTNYWTNTDPANQAWTAVISTFGVTFLHRVYSNRSITVTLDDLIAKNKYGIREAAFSMRQDIQVETIQEALLQASETLSKERRMYKNILVTPVTDRIPMGTYCRIQDIHSGLDRLVDIIGVEGYFSSTAASNVGVDTLSLTLQEIQG